MTHPNLNICLVPHEICWGDKDKNIKNLSALVDSVHHQTDLMVLPETFSTGFPTGKDKEEIRVLAERNTGPTIDFLKNISKDRNMAIAGSFIADSGGLLYNRAFFIEPSGDEYFADKRHLFSPGGENKIFRPGNSRMKVRFRGWNISMIVCYDLRFPVWCRNVNNDYDLLLAVANWPQKRIDVWDTLLKARAIENVAYVCGVNCHGEDNNGIVYDGSSHAFDYIGREISVKVDESGLIYASLSLKKLNDFRENFPVARDADLFELF